MRKSIISPGTGTINKVKIVNGMKLNSIENETRNSQDGQQIDKVGWKTHTYFWSDFHSVLQTGNVNWRHKEQAGCTFSWKQNNFFENVKVQARSKSFKQSFRYTAVCHFQIHVLRKQKLLDLFKVFSFISLNLFH